jgi:hypothetical protein
MERKGIRKQDSHGLFGDPVWHDDEYIGSAE